MHNTASVRKLNFRIFYAIQWDEIFRLRKFPAIRYTRVHVYTRRDRALALLTLILASMRATGSTMVPRGGKERGISVEEGAGGVEGGVEG